MQGQFPATLKKSYTLGERGAAPFNKNLYLPPNNILVLLTSNLSSRFDV